MPAPGVLYTNRTSWFPGATGTAISASIAATIGTGTPSTVADHPGSQDSMTRRKPLLPVFTVISIRILSPRNKPNWDTPQKGLPMPGREVGVLHLARGKRMLRACRKALAHHCGEQPEPRRGYCGRRAYPWESAQMLQYRLPKP